MSLILGLLALLHGAAPDTSSCKWPDRPDSVWTLPRTLDEISGIAVAPGGRVLAHGDERGRLFALDRGTGRVLGRWPLTGEPADDFEGITIVDTRVFLLTSRGVLYQTGLPTDTVAVALPFVTQVTGLEDRCEFEGLAAERQGRVLLFGCKEIHRDGREVGLRIFRWDVARRALATPATIDISEEALRQATPWKGFATSALDVDPVTGNIVVLSGRLQGIVELSPAGIIVSARELRPKWHRQPEGIAVLPGGIQLVSDEAAGKSATLSLYRCRP